MELRRRRVFRVAGLYIVTAWVGVQVASLVFPAIDIDESALRFVWVGFILGFPLAMVFAWLYDVTPTGISRTPPSAGPTDTDLRLRRADYVILVVLLMVVSTLAFQLSSEIRRFDANSPSLPTNSYMDSRTIAVLPLVNMSKDDSEQFFVDGMHDTLISMLSRVSAFSVISRTSARRFAKTEKSLIEIGRELGAANIIEGSVIRQGSIVRINIQLIDAVSGQLLWANIYDKQIEDVLRLQSELARTIAGEIQVLLTPEESAYLASVDRIVPEAYENYLKGRFHWYRFGENDLNLALEYFQTSIDMDPTYALAYVGLADATATKAHIGLMPATHVFPKAIKLVEQALELDPLLAEAHDLSARIKFVWNFDWLGADRGFRESIRLNPSYPDGRVVYSQFLAIKGRWEESLNQVKAGLKLDPLNDWFRIEHGSRQSWMGNNDEARDEYLLIANEQPNWFMPYRYLWEVYSYRNELGLALEAAVNYYQLLGEAALAEVISGFDGRTEYHAAMQALASAMIAASSESYVSEFEVARILAFGGDAGQTLDWLERAHTNKDPQLVYSVVDPLFALVWDEPRFADLRRKMNLPAKLSNN